MSNARITSKTKLITIRMPHEYEAELRRLGKEQGRSWQAIMKEILGEGLGLIQTSAIETKVYKSKLLTKALRKARK